MPGLLLTTAQQATPLHPAEQQPVKQLRQEQGTVTRPFEPVYGASAWTAAEYQDHPDKWTHRLSAAELAELDAAVDAVQKSGREIQDVTQASVQLPTLGRKLLAIRGEIINGRGFQVIKGVPVERYSRRESLIAYWIIGLWFGKAVSNNKKGHLVGHIKDIGHDPSLLTTRLYATTAAQPFHNDSSDIVGLMCLANAKEGGDSSWSSSVAVHNEMLRRAPRLARELARRGIWYFDRKGEIPDRSNGQGWFELPVFNYYQGYLSTNYSPNYYFASQRHPEVPRLTAEQKEAIQMFDQLAGSPELALTGRLEPGDIQLLNNHTILHARSEFVDHLAETQKRHLLRLWLSPDDERPLPSYYAELLGGSVEVGNRGGIHVGGRNLFITEEAE